LGSDQDRHVEAKEIKSMQHCNKYSSPTMIPISIKYSDGVLDFPLIRKSAKKRRIQEYDGDQATGKWRWLLSLFE
jgi:hypothetical protein